MKAMSKDQQLSQKEFYSELLVTLETGKTVMSRKDALQVLIENPYYEDLSKSLQDRLENTINTKTNWGKNLLLSTLQVEMLEYLLGL
jgi:hypothetical protein